MRRSFLAAAATATAFAALSQGSVLAEGANCDDPGRTVIGEESNGPLYIDVRYVGDPLYDAVWVYLEDNGTAGLQRGGYSEVLGSEEPCRDGVVPPDRLIF